MMLIDQVTGSEIALAAAYDRITPISIDHAVMEGTNLHKQDSYCLGYGFAKVKIIGTLRSWVLSMEADFADSRVQASNCFALFVRYNRISATTRKHTCASLTLYQES